MLGSTMWNMVVITTADEDQKTAFEDQIKDKIDRLELPLDLPIHIVADPPGPSRIGNISIVTMTTLMTPLLLDPSGKGGSIGFTVLWFCLFVCLIVRFPRIDL